MRVVFTRQAVADLDEISEFLLANYPQLAIAVEQRMHTVISRIAAWPESAQRVVGSPGIRSVPLLRYP